MGVAISFTVFAPQETVGNLCHCICETAPVNGTVKREELLRPLMIPPDEGCSLCTAALCHERYPGSCVGNHEDGSKTLRTITHCMNRANIVYRACIYGILLLTVMLIAGTFLPAGAKAYLRELDITS